jgi:hypothetical protein
MISEVSKQIEKVGLENVAKALNVTPNEVAFKIDHPESVTLSEMIALQAIGFSDRTVILMLDKLKREE